MIDSNDRRMVSSKRIRLKHSLDRLLLILLLLIDSLLEQQSFPPQLLAIRYDGNCPEEETLFPCDCDLNSHSIRCGSSITNPLDLRFILQDSFQVFWNSRISTLKNAFSYEIFKLENSSLNKLVPKTFGSYRFRTIIIRNNYYLSEIESNAFHETDRSLETLEFESNLNLFSTNHSISSIFKTIGTFLNLIELTINKCGLQFLPRLEQGAFKNLKRFFINNNPLKTIASNTFQLPALRVLDLSHNRISSIESDAIQMLIGPDCLDQFQHEVFYFIDLSHNDLGADSFQTRPFQSDCSLELKLNNNSINVVEERIFRPLFYFYTKLILYQNKLSCNDCRMAWLLKERFCYDYNQTIQYYSIIQSDCDSLHRYYFITECEKFREKFQSLSLPSTSSSIAIVDEYSRRFPYDFIENDPNLLKCPNENLSSSSKGMEQISILILILSSLRILIALPSSI
ncbi:Organic cation transporter 1 [Sarcoptes scabiei]|nr:Organic cation transporter 1 [Sarcoptes scabiei]